MLLPPVPLLRQGTYRVGHGMDGGLQESATGRAGRKGFSLRKCKVDRVWRRPEREGISMLGELPSASDSPERTARPVMTSCPSALIFLPQVVLPTPLPFLAALPGSCSGVGGHRGQETARLAGARQTRSGLGIPSSLPDPSRLSSRIQHLLQVIHGPSLLAPTLPTHSLTSFLALTLH